MLVLKGACVLIHLLGSRLEAIIYKGRLGRKGCSIGLVMVMVFCPLDFVLARVRSSICLSPMQDPGRSELGA